jgi:tRNA uridine 5-carbamoylmethylation protein Kti12
MDTSLEQCLYRNAHRENRLQDFIVESSYRSLQKPTLDEGWDEIIYVKEDGAYESDFTSN